MTHGAGGLLVVGVGGIEGGQKCVIQKASYVVPRRELPTPEESRHLTELILATSSREHPGLAGAVTNWFTFIE